MNYFTSRWKRYISFAIRYLYLYGTMLSENSHLSLRLMGNMVDDADGNGSEKVKLGREKTCAYTKLKAIVEEYNKMVQ